MTLQSQRLQTMAQVRAFLKGGEAADRRRGLVVHRRATHPCQAALPQQRHARERAHRLHQLPGPSARGTKAVSATMTPHRHQRFRGDDVLVSCPINKCGFSAQEKGC
ncbi:MAG: hypothetical protein OXE81_07780, partial [Gammaproteobacteria bacterium]|nr:hypothetical protein [Gammaproteobacteria bacterium]